MSDTYAQLEILEEQVNALIEKYQRASAYCVLLYDENTKLRQTLIKVLNMSPSEDIEALVTTTLGEAHAEDRPN